MKTIAKRRPRTVCRGCQSRIPRPAQAAEKHEPKRRGGAMEEVADEAAGTIGLPADYCRPRAVAKRDARNIILRRALG